MRIRRRLSGIAYLSVLVAGLAACGDDDELVDGGCRGASCDEEDAAETDTLDAGTDADGQDPDAGGADARAMDAGDGLQEVTIRFQAKLGDQELVCGRHYPGLGATHITATPQDFRFFVQEVRLLRKGSGQEEKVVFDVLPPFQRSDLALIDFTDARGSCGAKGGSIINTEIRGKVPVGTYDGVVFVNGVPEELNHAGPAETAGAPLDDVTLFWNWLGGYRFIVAELLPIGGHDAGQPDAALGTHADGGVDAGVHDAGTAATSDAGAGHGASLAAFVHIGSTGCSGTPSTGFECTRKARNEIKLSGFDPTRNTIIADLAEVFRASNLMAPPQCHGVAAPCAAPYAAFGIDMNTGNPAATQQVFRVE